MRNRWRVRRSSCYRRRRRYAARPRGASPRGCGCFLLIAAVIALLVWSDRQLDPLVRDAVAQQAGQVSVQAVNEAVRQALDQTPLPQNYLTVVRGEDGTVLSAAADAAAVNRLKTALNLRIQQSLNELGVCSVPIPIGSLIGGNLLRGLGPKLPVRFTVTGDAFCDLVSRFDSAGINQTRHTLSLTVTTEIYAMIPGCSAKNSIETTFPIAETLIVGSVPQLLGYPTAAGETPAAQN